MWFLASLFLPLIFYCDGNVPTNLLYVDPQLYEGSRCQLKSGAGEGVCIKALECPGVVEQIWNGKYVPVDRCGFDKFEEITCCAMPQYVKSRLPDRPAEIACEKHKQHLDNIIRYNAPPNGGYNPALANAKEFPHIAALGYSVSDEEAATGVKFHCGGTLISPKHVLTAAHCVNNVDGLVPVEVVLGTNDLSDIRSASVQRIPISRIVKHPDHKPGLNYHDVAILELKYPAESTLDVYPTCLMNEPLTRENANAHTPLSVLGWGGFSAEGTNAMKLLKADHLKFVNKKMCCKRYSNAKANVPNGLDDAMICVRDPDANRRADTCLGGGGGPLLISSTYLPRVIGIASFGHACGETAPSIYTSVYKYLDWIEDQVWPNSD